MHWIHAIKERKIRKGRFSIMTHYIHRQLLTLQYLEMQVALLVKVLNVIKLALGLLFFFTFSLMDSHYLYLGWSLPLIMGHWELYSTLSLLGTFFFLYFSLFSSAHYGGKWWFLCSYMTVRLIEQPLHSWAHDQECQHMIVSLIMWLSVSLASLPLALYSHSMTHSQLLLYADWVYVCPTLHYPILYFLTVVSLYL